MSTLFDFLPDAPAPDVLCALMPWMGTACGQCICGGCAQCRADGCLCATRATPRATLGPYSAVTCPDCLARGDLAGIARAAQNRQAAVTA